MILLLSPTSLFGFLLLEATAALSLWPAFDAAVSSPCSSCVWTYLTRGKGGRRSVRGPQMSKTNKNKCFFKIRLWAWLFPAFTLCRPFHLCKGSAKCYCWGKQVANSDVVLFYTHLLQVWISTLNARQWKVRLITWPYIPLILYCMTSMNRPALVWLEKAGEGFWWPRKNIALPSCSTLGSTHHPAVHLYFAQIIYVL